MFYRVSCLHLFLQGRLSRPISSFWCNSRADTLPRNIRPRTKGPEREDCRLRERRGQRYSLAPNEDKMVSGKKMVLRLQLP